MTIALALREATARIRGAGIEAPRLEAEVLLSACLGKERPWLIGERDAPLAGAERERYHDLVQRRCGGEPAAYLTGWKEFYGLAFRVTPEVFIPRPETEGVVDRVLAIGRTMGVRFLVDACTGCGNIGVVAKRLGGFPSVAATEIDPGVIDLARWNAERLGASVEFRQGDLLRPLFGTPWEGRTDMVCSNPPYVPRGELEGLPREVRHEPSSALDGGRDGLALVRQMFRQAGRLLRRGGAVILEIGEDQGESAASAARAAGYTGIRVEPDLAGRNRYLTAWRGSSEDGEAGR
ncbi:MAG: peptide chain release factor N(5)-glutamine methyltransferase [Planctomycetota bacterium]